MPSTTSVTDAYAQHRARVEAVARGILRDADEAKDVAADTFIALIEHGPDDPDKTLAWLLTSARNRARNRIRQRIRGERRERLTAPTVSIADIEPDDGRRELLLREALERLAVRDRVAVTMRHLEGRRYDEIAEELGTTRAQARVVVHRATTRLRTHVIRALGRHHGFADSCVSALDQDRRARHRGCSSCRTLSDELAAMTAGGLLPVISPLLHRIATSMGSLRPPRIGTLPGVDRLAEGVMALVLGATAVAGVPTMAADAEGPTSETQRTAVARGYVEPSGERDVRARGETGPAGGSSARGTDASGDAERDILTLLTTPTSMRVLDPEDPAYAPGLDLRALEVRSTRGTAGRYNGLAFSLELAGEPTAESFYVMDFSVGQNCDGDLTYWTSEGNATLAVNCWIEDETTGSRRTSVSGGLIFHPVIDGNVITFPIKVRDMDGEVEPLLQPGTTLRDISGVTGEGMFIGFGVDHGPDSGPFGYTIT